MAEIVIEIEEIEDVIPLYPDLVSKDYKETIIYDYKNLLDTKESLYKYREIVRELEVALKEREDKFNKQSQFFNIVYKTEIKQGVDKPEYADTMHVKGKVY